MQAKTGRKLRFEQSIAKSDSIIESIRQLMSAGEKQQRLAASVEAERRAIAQATDHQCIVMEAICTSEHSRAMWSLRR